MASDNNVRVVTGFDGQPWLRIRSSGRDLVSIEATEVLAKTTGKWGISLRPDEAEGLAHAILEVLYQHRRDRPVRRILPWIGAMPDGFLGEILPNGDMRDVWQEFHAALQLERARRAQRQTRAARDDPNAGVRR